MTTQLQLGDITIEVTRKSIKNVHLSVHPPTGRVRVSAPERLSLETLRTFIISKLGWIRKQQEKLRQQERETPREYLDRESHYVWGKRYLLKVIEVDLPPTITLKHSRMLLTVRPGTDEAKRHAIVDGWYRGLVREAVPPLIAKWEPIMGVKVERFFVRQMRTRWGTCNPRARSIRINTDLAKKPAECLEYIIVHEMTHLLEPHHNDRFIALMDRLMPQWRIYRGQLNQLPVRHEDWVY